MPAVKMKTSEAAVKASIFFIRPERPRDYFVLLTRVTLLTCLVTSIALVLHSAFYTPSHIRLPPSTRLPVPRPTGSPTNLSHVLFCIAAAADSLSDRTPYISLWWSPNATRAAFWLDRPLKNKTTSSIPVRVSDRGWTRFKYTSSRAAVRIARVIWDSYKLDLPDVRWFVMGDDDTVFFTEAVVSMLARYDYHEMWYIGGNSESVEQNVMHDYNMAYGGGGFAVSRPLAKRLVEAMDGCLERYYYFYGSDQRIAACISEIGVPFTKQPGFHQLDIRGNPYGLLAAHPLAPLVSLHHIPYLEPMFPNKTQIDSLEGLMKAYRVDPHRILQQTFCYDSKQKWSISISWGYTVQIYTRILTAKVLETPLQTFKTWRSWSDGPFTFNTRSMSSDPCERPIVYFLHQVHRVGLSGTRTTYRWANYTADTCNKKEHVRATAVQRIVVSSMKMDPDYWNKAQRRHCCEVIDKGRLTNRTMFVRIRKCKASESISA